MEIDQSVLESLPLPQRQKLCKQLRQEQVRRYNDWNSREQNSPVRQSVVPQPNRKGCTVSFNREAVLLDAVTSFNDREGQLSYLQFRTNRNFVYLQLGIREDNAKNIPH